MFSSDSYVIDCKESKSWSIYSKVNDRYYVQHVNWNERLGIYVPNSRKRISKDKFIAMHQYKSR